MPAGYSFALLFPELVLGIGALALLIIGAIQGEKSTNLVTELAVGLIGVALIGVVAGHSEGVRIGFDGAFVDDTFGRFMQALALIGSLVTLVMAIPFLRREGIHKFEYPVLIMLSTMGMMVLISAGNLIALYLGFELMSLALYVIAAFHRDDVRASEAGLKYFVLGALSSGMLLYGASLIYGFAGTVSFIGIAQSLQGHQAIGVIFGLVFLSAGLAFKMSAVPFHMWTPDVYQGAPTPVTAFFATAPKMAAVAITVRVIITAFPGIQTQWQQIIVFIAIASMLLGSFAAIGQRNFKRLMAYSAIGNMGFALTGFAAGTEAGVYGVLIYMSAYLIMTLGTFRGHALDAAQGPRGRDRGRPGGARSDESGDGVLSCHDHVLAGRRPAPGRLLRQILRVPGRDPGQPVLAGRDRRLWPASWRPTTTCASSR